MATRVDGGVIAIRGFAYQFDQTILAALDRPSEEIEVEHIEDLNGADWCVQVKNYSNSYKPATLTNAIENLWRLHLTQPDRVLRIHCHFADKTDGTKLSYNHKTIPSTWKRRLTLAGKQAGTRAIGHFLRRLTIHFTLNLESQFSTLIARIQKDLNKKTEEDAVLTHAVFRAHILELSTQKDKAKRRLSLTTLKNIENAHRSLVLEFGHAQYIGEERYINIVSRKLFPKQFNLNCVERAFIIDVGEGDDLSVLKELIIHIGDRFFKMFRSGSKGKPPVICIRGIPDDERQGILDRVYELLALRLAHRSVKLHLPLVDGHPFQGSTFRLSIISMAGEECTAQLRVLHPDALKTSEVKSWLASFEHIYHFRTDLGCGPALHGSNVKHVFARDISVIARMLA